MAKDQVSVEITIEEKQALKALAQLTRGVENFEKGATTSVKKADKSFDSFKGNLAAIATSGAIKAIGTGLKELVIGSLQAAASTEKIRTQLEILTGSQEKAASLYKELTAFSASTPFQLQGIAEASAQLISFGFSADTVTTRIGKIGEVAAGSGADLKEIALIYGQVAAAGKLTGERLLQFQERAIPIGPALAKSLGVAESEVKGLVSSGVVGFNEFEEAFNSLSQAGGLFEGAIEKQSQTLNGVLSTLGDNFFILQSEIGDAFKPELIDGAKVIIGSLQDLTRVLIDNRDVLAKGIGFISDYIGVYAELATSIATAETPLDKLNEAIEKNIENAAVLISRKKDLESDKGTFFGVFDANSALGIEKINILLSNQDKELKRLIEQKKSLNAVNSEEKTAEVSTDPGAPDIRVAKEKEVSAQILEQRKQLELQLGVIREEKNVKEAEAKIAQLEMGVEERVMAIESLRAFEMAKADAQLTVELEKNTKIRDAKARALADEAANIKSSIVQRQNQAKAESAILAARLANEQGLVKGFGLATSQASAIAKKGSIEQQTLAIASATINTYAAATRAFRDYPFPANIAVMATTIASGFDQVAQIRNQSFATGGVFGGFNGATNGNDNTTANVRTGEMVLNSNQQRRLFDIADNSDRQGGGVTNLEIVSIVQIDEREIARSVRNQKLEGFQ